LWIGFLIDRVELTQVELQVEAFGRRLRGVSLRGGVAPEGEWIARDGGCEEGDGERAHSCFIPGKFPDDNPFQRLDHAIIAPQGLR